MAFWRKIWSVHTGEPKVGRCVSTFCRHRNLLLVGTTDVVSYRIGLETPSLVSPNNDGISSPLVRQFYRNDTHKEHPLVETEEKFASKGQIIL